MSHEVIKTNRLDLVLLNPEFLRCTAQGRREEARGLLAADVPDDWFAFAWLASLRLEQLQKVETAEPWLPRAIIWRERGMMVGHIGFHTTPAPDYLRDLCPGGVELGYTVYPAHRRQGLATEAIQGLVHWAHSTHGVTAFVFSISPQNEPSLALAARLGLRRIGAHIDAIDGPEDIFALHLP